jgi:hypothetical protein
MGTYKENFFLLFILQISFFHVKNPFSSEFVLFELDLFGCQNVKNLMLFLDLKESFKKCTYEKEIPRTIFYQSQEKPFSNFIFSCALFPKYSFRSGINRKFWTFLQPYWPVFRAKNVNLKRDSLYSSLHENLTSSQQKIKINTKLFITSLIGLPPPPPIPERKYDLDFQKMVKIAAP